MDWFISLLLASVTVYVCVLMFRSSRSRDATALEEEIEQDFKEEFASDKSGELTDKGMEDMLDWWEAKDEAERMQGIEEVGDPDNHPSSEA